MKWKCPICNLDQTNDVCPQCGDDLRKWKEMSACASLLCGEGSYFAQHGQKLRATLAFTKASMLQPRDPSILKALGGILAQQGEYEEAAAYFNRCLALTPGDTEAQAALSKIASLQNPPPPAAAVTPEPQPTAS